MQVTFSSAQSYGQSQELLQANLQAVSSNFAVSVASLKCNFDSCTWECLMAMQSKTCRSVLTSDTPRISSDCCSAILDNIL